MPVYGKKGASLQAKIIMNKKLKYILKKEQLQHLLPIFKNQCVTDLILGDLSANDLRDSGIDKLAEQRLLEVFKTTAVSPALGHFVKVKGGALPKASELAGKKVETFEVGMHPVTVKEWNDVKRWAIKEDVGIDIRNLREQPLGCPVTWVDWYDCAMWCNAKSMMENLNPAYSMPNRHDASRFDIEIDWRANGYRLPTEHEWEWAARGGCNSQSYTFAGSNNLNDVGWHSDNADGVVQAVGKKMPNEL